jgi:predicted nucleic acid-binding protein
VTLVVDASVVAAALVDTGAVGTWAETQLERSPLAAPHLLPVEVASILRRSCQAGDLTTEVAAMAHADLLDLRIDLFSYEPFGGRVWELRENLTSYDAWYVAVAETLDAPLATIDLRLSRAPGPRCPFSVPP